MAYLMLKNRYVVGKPASKTNKLRMKKIFFSVLVAAFGLAWSAQAADKDPGKALTPEQQKERAELVKKYDTNKDGVLDKTEAKKMSRGDKKALAKLGGIGTAQNPEEKSKDGDKPADPAKGDKGKGK